MVPRINDCWLYEHPLNHNGYGLIYWEHKTRRVHRVAWELFNGPIPKDLQILHKCDVRNCVNPQHLYLGTHSDNMQDRIKSGHNSFASRTHCSHGHKYTKKNTMRHSGIRGRVCRICRRHWQHIADVNRGRIK